MPVAVFPVLFFPASAGARPSDPGGWEVSEAWDEGGIFAFLNRLPRTPAEHDWLAREASGHDARVIWVDLHGSDPGESTVHRLPPLPGAGGVEGALELGGYRLALRGPYGVDVTRASNEDDPPCLLLRPVDSGLLTFGRGDFEARVAEVRIPVVDAAAGSLVFDLALDSRGFEAMDVGCRFFRNDPRSAAAVESFFFPLFSPERGVPLEATIDLLRPLDPSRTHFSFLADATVPSWFRTVLGNPLSLRPVATDAQLVFERLPPSDEARAGDEARPGDALYLVPDGAFHLMADHGGSKLLCGLSGTEFVQLAPDAMGNRLTFHPGRPAFSPAAGADGDLSRAPRLLSTASTSWVSMDGATAPHVYYAQPERAAFHGGAGGVDSGHIPYYPIIAGQLRNGSADTGAEDTRDVFPLVPHAGVKDRREHHARLERDVLSIVRRSLVAPPDFDEADPNASPVRALTKAGLAADFSPEGEWRKLSLAVAGSERLALERIAGELRTAFTADPQFVVITDPARLTDHFEEHSISVEGWRFDLDPAGWSRHDTVMIVKSFESQSLAQLAADPSKWTCGEYFNRRTDRTSRLLAKILESDPADSTSFRDVVDDPSWSGVLFLNVPVPLDELPTQLAGLAAGIDKASFFAHHIGVSHSSVKDDLDLEDSSLFGLIRYPPPNQVPRLRTNSYSDYDFRVDLLEIHFEHSTIQSFASSITLSMNRLFGSTVAGPRKEVQLNGALERHDGVDVYTFATSERLLLQLNDPVLQAVQIDGATYELLQSTEDAGVQSRFSFIGEMHFSGPASGDHTVFDAFSFDRLSFAKLGLNMSFPPQDPMKRTFAFDASRINFDESASLLRSASLAAQFPIHPRRIISRGPAKNPMELGFQAVQLPVDLGSLGSNWYGLVCDLDLGTLGSLAGDLSLSASLALVWTAGGRSDQVFVGIRIPGLDVNAGGLNLQGVLKLAMSRVKLLHDTDAARPGYRMQLLGVGVSFFGVRLPRGESITLNLFGDPEGSAGSNTVGWYGDYLGSPPASKNPTGDGS